MNPDLMRFDLLYKKPPETEPAPPPKELRPPVLRHDNPAHSALEWACAMVGRDTDAVLEEVTAYDVTSDGFAFDLTFSGVRPAYGGVGPPVSTRWYATIDHANKRCTRVEVVLRG